MGISSLPGLGDAFLPLAFLPLLLLRDGVGWMRLHVTGKHEDAMEPDSSVAAASMRHRRRKLDQQVEEEWCCSVCLHGLEGKEELSQVVVCGHLFHQSCLDRWLLVGMGNTCPLCRSTLH